MLHPVPPGCAHALPGYGASRVLVDGAPRPTFDERGALVIALTWVAGLLLAVALGYRRATRVARSTAARPQVQAALQPARP